MSNISREDLIGESNALLHGLLNSEDKMKFSLWLDMILQRYFDDYDYYDDLELYQDFCKKHPYTARRISMYKRNSDGSMTFILGDHKTGLIYDRDGNLTSYYDDSINKEEYSNIGDLEYTRKEFFENDDKIGLDENDSNERILKDKILQDIKDGKGLPPLNDYEDCGGIGYE